MFLYLADLSLITMACLIFIIYHFGKNISLQKWKIPEADQSSNKYHLIPETYEFLIWLRDGLSEAFDNLLKYRTYNNAKFTIHCCTLLLICAYLGHLFSGLNLSIITVYFILLAPGFNKKQIPQKLYAKILPHINKVQDILERKFGGKKRQVMYSMISNFHNFNYQSFVVQILCKIFNECLRIQLRHLSKQSISKDRN